MLSTELKQKIDLLWNQFWSNGMADHMNALRHISYLIFMKKLEDNENDRIIASKKTGKKYTSIFDGNDTMRWSVWKNWAGDKMRSHVRENVFPFLKKIESNGRIRLDLGDSNFEIESPILLKNTVDVIEDLKISEQNYDTQGDIYEYVLSKLTKAGLNGQFRTPRHIIRMMVKLIDPDVNQKICDPACGTGGFLINSYLHILEKYTSPELLENDEDGKAILPLGNNLSKKERDFLLNDQLFGFDYETSMVQIAQMNMILHGFEKPNILYGNSVGKDFKQEEEYDVILANPPFAGNLNKSEIHEDFDVSTTKTELLFTELFFNLLKVGGKAGIIIPESVLTQSSKNSKVHKDIRQLLVEKCQLDAVITMPSGVFEPYAGVSTAVLIFTKGGTNENVWFYQMTSDGFTLDKKRDLIDGKGDIPDIIDQFSTKGITKNSFVVSFADIKKNDYKLNPTLYKKQKIQKINYESPEIMLNNILDHEKNIQTDLEKLKSVIKELK